MLLDTEFRPSRHGFAFPNAWRDPLVGVVASRGRCGGMVLAALDAFAADEPLDSSARSLDPPRYDSALAHQVARRQFDSVATHLGMNLWQFVRFTYLPTASTPGTGAATRRELLTLFDALRSGRPVPLGMVSEIGLTRMATNHQVLAYAADFGEGRVTVRVYDPNYPLRDDVVLDVPLDIDSLVVERMPGRVKVWRGFFVEHYVPRRGGAGHAASGRKAVKE